MDKINPRKARIDVATETAENAGMDEEIYEALFEDAHRLAYRYFREPTDEHIKCVYFRLVKNREWGTGDEGAVTVH